MHWLRLTIVLIIVALLQVTVAPALEVRHVRPDLLLLVAVCIAVREPLGGRSRWHAFWTGWLAGLAVDVFSAGSPLPFGSTALVFGLVAIGMSKLGEELFLESAIAQILVLAPACLAAHLALAVALLAFRGGHAGATLGRGFWTAMYSALAGPVVFAVLGRFERFLGMRSRRSFGRV